MVAFDRIPAALCSELESAFPGRRLLGAWLYGSRAQGRERAGSDVDSADAFTLLERESVLSPAVADRIRRMVGFRNIAVHEYRRLDPAVVRTVVAYRLDDFENLCRELAAGD